MAPSLLEAVVPHLADRFFAPKEHAGHGGTVIGTELCLREDSPVAPMLSLLANQEGLLRAAEELADSTDAFRFFDGRCYQMLPGVHFDSWHSDWGEGRRVGLSLNMQPRPISGGELQLRDDKTGVMNTFPAPAFGDACIFRLAPHLAHRTLAVKGDVPKRSYAGWFSIEPRAAGPLLVQRRQTLVSARARAK